MSWLHLPRYYSHSFAIRSRTARLPKDMSSSTVGRSVISAPTLQSTTNEDVAKSEGVHWGELFNTTGGNTVAQFMTRGAQEQQIAHENEHSNHEANVLASRIDTAIKNCEDMAELEGKGQHGQTKENLPAFRQLLAKLRPHRGYASRTHQFERLEDEQRLSSSSTDHGMSRRRTETLNLYKDKIRCLTGHGNIKRKAMPDPKQDSTDNGTLRDHEALLGNQTPLAQIDNNIFFDNEPDGDFQFGSLSRSFASAVDMLDFQPTMGPRKKSLPFMRSRTSLRDLLGRNKDDEGTKQKTSSSLNISSPIGLQSSSLNVSSTIGFQSLSSHGSSVTDFPPNLRQAIATSLPSESGINPKTPIEKSKVEPSAFVPSLGKIVPKPQDINSKYPRGVNPLRMHPEVMAFASPPAIEQGEGKSLSAVHETYQIPPADSNEDDDDMMDELEDVPIYSPSMGDLSQYSNSTKSPAASNMANQPSLNDLYGRNRTVQYDTPTKPPGKKTSGQASGRLKISLKKSLSNVGLFQKSQSENAMGGHKKPRQEVHKSEEGANQHLALPFRPRDENRAMTPGGKEVKKSKSMGFGSLGRKPKPHETMELPVLPYQPTTPSPLRHGRTAKYSSHGNKHPEQEGEQGDGRGDGPAWI